MRLRELLGFLAIGTLAVAPVNAWAARPVLEPIDPPATASFERALIERGAQLAAIGNCYDCHTAPGGKAYAGGRALKTTFGTIHGTNITPDPETGIGRWSEAAFSRAMREGVDRRGRHLYPAFPYDYFTKLTDDDIKALYAFIMTRDAVRAQTPPNRLAFPFNIRGLIGVWKGLFFERGAFQPDTSRSAEWNRGAYLVNGVGHCGACHTPRNSLGAEKKNEFFAGGEAGGWHAPALNASSPSPVPWAEERLFIYLRTGLADLHAVPAGPMAPVVRNLATVPEQDVRAIAAYIASTMGQPSVERQKHAQKVVAQANTKQALAGPDTASSKPPAFPAADGAAIYAGACGFCHDSGRTASSGGALPLELAIAVAIPTPRNLIHIIQEGIIPPEGERARYMPSFGGAFTDEQWVALLNYIRTDLGRYPAWQNLQDEVQKVTREKPQR